MNGVISRYAAAGDKIIDTHAGSGACLIAAHRTQHQFIGFEIDEDYFRKADEPDSSANRRRCQYLILYNRRKHNGEHRCHVQQQDRSVGDT